MVPLSANIVPIITLNVIPKGLGLAKAAHRRQSWLNKPAIGGMSFEGGVAKMTRDHCEIHQQFKAVDAAYCTGDLEALRAALGNPPDFPNCIQPSELALGEYPLEYAIYWSPLCLIDELIAIGANPNYPDHGFPSLIAALSSGRSDQHELMRLLIKSGANVNQRGLNDWTALHYAVVLRDLEGVRILLAHGANPTLRTRIDDCTSPLEDAETMGFTSAVEMLRQAHSTASGVDR